MTDRRLRVVHTVSSLRIGGMEQVVVRLAAAQKEQGYDVAVLAIHEGPLQNDLMKRRIDVTILGAGRLTRAMRALRYFRSVCPDVVHVHNPTSLQYAVLSRLVTSASIVMTLHGEKPARRGSWVEWRMVKRAAVVSNAAVRVLRLPCSPDKVSIVHNGIALAHESSTDRERMRVALGLGDRFVGIIVARLSGQKGHATLLRTLAILASRGIDVGVLVVGDGPERHALERLAEELSLGSHYVRFLGARADVDSLLAAADFFVLPSDTEGLPLSVLEGMSHGLPIVASHVGGIPELIVNGREGLLVAPGEPIALADAVERLARDQPLRHRLGVAARKRAEDQFSLESTVGKYDALYRRALQS